MHVWYPFSVGKAGVEVGPDPVVLLCMCSSLHSLIFANIYTNILHYMHVSGMRPPCWDMQMICVRIIFALHDYVTTQNLEYWVSTVFLGFEITVILVCMYIYLIINDFPHKNIIYIYICIRKCVPMNEMNTSTSSCVLTYTPGRLIWVTEIK